MSLRTKKHFYALVLSGLVLPVLSGCKAKPVVVPVVTEPSMTDREVAFVKGFYAYYGPLASNDFPAFAKAVADRPEVFDGPLLAALKNDQAFARGRHADSSTELAFDPFGYASDPARTTVKVVGATGDRVHVQSFLGDKAGATEDLQVRCADECRLQNVFFGPGAGLETPDLLSLLAHYHPAK